MINVHKFGWRETGLFIAQRLKIGAAFAKGRFRPGRDAAQVMATSATLPAPEDLVFCW